MIFKNFNITLNKKLLLASFFLFICCNKNDCNICLNEVKTSHVIDYLEHNLHIENPKESQLYIILSAYACSGCTSTVTNYLKKNFHNNNKISLIVNGDTKKEIDNIVNDLKPMHKIYYNFNEDLNNLLQFNSNAAIIINNEKVSFFTFDPKQNIDLILNTIDEYYY